MPHLAQDRHAPSRPPSTSPPAWGPPPTGPTPPSSQGWAPPSWPPAPPDGPPPSSQGWAPPSWPPAPPDGPPPSWGQPPADHDPKRPTVGLQNLLLGLGTALVAIALIVFTAVNWRRLDATFQGLVLVGLTVVAATASRVSTRREMPASAEAMGLVAVLLALADVHAFRVGLAPTADAGLWWASGLALVSVGGWLLGRGGVRSPRIAASVLVQWPLLLVLEALATDHSRLPSGLAAHGALVLQGAIVVVAACRLAGVPRWGRILGSLQAASVVAILTMSLTVGALDGRTSAYGLSVGLVLTACFALLVAVLRAASEPQRVVGLLVASILGLAAAAVAAGPELGVQGGLAALSLAGAVLLVTAVRLPARWGQVPGAIASSGLLIGSVELLSGTSTVLIAASRVADRAWELDGARRAASLQLPEAQAPGAPAIVAALAALAIVVAGTWRLLRPAMRASALAAVALLVLVLAPVILPLSIAATAATGSAVAVAAAGGAWVLRRGRVELVAPLAVAAAGFAWSVVWGLASPGLTIGVLVAGAVAALLATAASTAAGRPELALPASGWFGAALAASCGTSVAAWGGSTAVSWAAAGVTAAVLAILGVVLIDPDGRARPAVRAAVLAGELVAASVHGIALAVVIDLGAVDPASVVLATGAITGGVLAARPSRRPLLVLAVLEVLALTWLRLGHAGVQLVEAYTLPLATVLLVAGLVADLRARRGGRELASWLTLGPGLAVALAPTTLLALAEPGSGRPLVGLVAGAAVLVAGALSGRRAAVDLGAAVVVGLGLRQLAPVAAELPNWVAIGLTGLVLLAVGATFEQRRRDLRVVRDRYAGLR